MQGSEWIFSGLVGCLGWGISCQGFPVARFSSAWKGSDQGCGVSVLPSPAVALALLAGSLFVAGCCGGSAKAIMSSKVVTDEANDKSTLSVRILGFTYGALAGSDTATCGLAIGEPWDVREERHGVIAEERSTKKANFSVMLWH